MTGLRTSTWIWASVGTAALTGAMVACSLNPQPLPPDTYNDAGVSGAAGGGDGGASLTLDSGVLSRPDAGTTMPSTGEDASSGASPDAGAADAGSSLEGGSSEAAGDAAIGATDAGVAADATTDGAADGSTDAAIDADDAPGEAD